MSFQNYGEFPAQAAQDGAAVPITPTPQEGTMGGQGNDPSQAQFQGVQGGDNNGMGGNQEGEKKTLWYVFSRNIQQLAFRHVPTDETSRMGELEQWIDENFVRNLWFQMGEQVNVKMIRDKFSG